MREAPRQHQTGLSLKTLLIAAVASATAAFLVPMFWERGTVFAAAMTPVIVAVVSELLKHPAEKVTSVTARRTKAGTTMMAPLPPPDEPFDPLAPAPAEELEALPQTTTQRAVHRGRGLTGRQWRLAIVTGLVAFAGAATVVTASELLAGERVGSASNPTTFLGKKERKREQATPEPTPSRSPTATRTPTATPAETPTPSASPTPVPTTTATPVVPAPAPESTAPASPTPAP